MASDCFQGSLAGKLLLCDGFHQEEAEVALAVTIAGGTFLGVEPDSQMLKAAIRNGSCDFMVNTLDEALRVLKNELRQRKPLSVGLLGETSYVFPAMAERGVQPDLIAEGMHREDTRGMEERHAVSQFLERGAQCVDVRDPQIETSPSLAKAESPQIEATWSTANLPDMRAMDKTALEWLPPIDTVRRRWLEQASGCFYRQTPLQRIFGVQPEEIDSLLGAFRNSGSRQAPVAIRWVGADGRSQSITI